MSESSLATAQRLFTQALDALGGVAEAGSASERLSVLTLCEGMTRQLDQVEMIARVLATKTAERLSPEQWAGAEEQLAARAPDYTPRELHEWGRALVELLDQNGEEPDDRPPAQISKLLLTRLPEGGGKMSGRFDDAATFDAIATAIDAHARPLTADDGRSVGQRQAEALADVCGYVLDHGDVPERGGHRPHLTVLIRLDDLQSRARAACLDFGGPVAPQALRMLCCDAAWCRW